MINKLKYAIFGLLFLTGCAIITIGNANKSKDTKPKVESDYAKTAVMITNKEMTSGGTGVILESNSGASFILTNKHVCQLVQTGGKVITDKNNSYAVNSYRVYKKHDLCLISVLKNLGVNVKIAKSAPKIYSPSVVVGHPALLPTIVTAGHFSKWQTIKLAVAMKECDGTEEDEEAFFCMFLGAKPVLKEFQAQVTSSLIMPGSSGSAVFNQEGELSGLIFAGHEGLSYGFMVPWEYVNDFLKNRGDYKEENPNPLKKPDNFFTTYFKFETFCNDKFSQIVDMQGHCQEHANLGLWHE